MPKKPVELLRVPLNCFVMPQTKEAITAMQNETRESQGQVVDRAMCLLALGEEVPPPVRRKKGKREREAEARAAADVTAQASGHAANIDYSDVESTPTTHVSALANEAPGRLERRSEQKASMKPVWHRGIREKGDKTR